MCVYERGREREREKEKKKKMMTMMKKILPWPWQMTLDLDLKEKVWPQETHMWNMKDISLIIQKVMLKSFADKRDKGQTDKQTGKNYMPTLMQVGEKRRRRESID